MNLLRRLIWPFITPIARNWEAENNSRAAAQLARHQHEQKRQRMLLVARAIRAAKGLPESEYLNG